jgi:hypothetical protein
MRRYVTRPRGAAVLFDDDGTATATAEEIIEAEEKPQPTGLLDAEGRPLYRVRERIKFGFVP